MFSKNLKYYRLKKALSKKQLAERIHVSPMAITNYENGTRKPNMDILQKMSKELGIRVSDFLAIRNENLVFRHGEFRKNAALSMAQQDYVRESVEEYFNRYMTIVEILGGDILPDAPHCHGISLSDDVEKDAMMLRKHLYIASDGPLDNLVEILENKGILIFVFKIENDKFSGMNGFVNDRPYIALNMEMSPERNRSTIAHELAHLMFIWPEEMNDKDIEDRATAISGAFLLPKSDAERELGIHRTKVSKDMVYVAKEYGVSMLLLVKRAQVLGIISDHVAKDFYVAASQAGWRKKEPVRIAKELPTFFEQLVFRAINENEISVQKGAELLKMPFDEVTSRCCKNEDELWSM